MYRHSRDDSPLYDDGAYKLIEKIWKEHLNYRKSNRFDLIIMSPFIRCIETTFAWLRVWEIEPNSIQIIIHPAFAETARNVRYLLKLSKTEKIKQIGARAYNKMNEILTKRGHSSMLELRGENMRNIQYIYEPEFTQPMQGSLSTEYSDKVIKKNYHEIRQSWLCNEDHQRTVCASKYFKKLIQQTKAQKVLVVSHNNMFDNKGLFNFMSKG